MTAQPELSPTTEEYLENIYRLQEEYGVARTKQLAELVGVSYGTVTNTIESLERRNLVLHEPYRGVKLTSRGRRLGVDVIRKHRLAERLLHDVIGVKWSDVHAYACKLEHVIDDPLTHAMDATLDHPRTCPHGNPIPTRDGTIAEAEARPLPALRVGDVGTVVKIVDERRELLEYLLTLNLVPGTTLTVHEKAPFDGPITVDIDGTRRSLGRNVAATVRVRREG